MADPGAGRAGQAEHARRGQGHLRRRHLHRPVRRPAGPESEHPQGRRRGRGVDLQGHRRPAARPVGERGGEHLVPSPCSPRPRRSRSRSATWRPRVLLGLTFAVLIILVFLLSLRSTIITAISIPLSLLVAMIGLWVGDFSLNIFTLAALTVAVGRVVDDSIVVIENIKRRDTGPELTPDAIVASVKEVAGAVTASTLTTVAVFVPLALVGGISGELLRPFAITVGIALGASLLVSLDHRAGAGVLVPALRQAQQGRHRPGRPRRGQGHPAAAGLPAGAGFRHPPAPDHRAQRRGALRRHHGIGDVAQDRLHRLLRRQVRACRSTSSFPSARDWPRPAPPPRRSRSRAQLSPRDQ